MTKSYGDHFKKSKKIRNSTLTPPEIPKSSNLKKSILETKSSLRTGDKKQSKELNKLFSANKNKGFDFSFFLLTALMMFFCWSFFNVDTIISFFERVEVGAFLEGHASSSEEKKSQVQEKNSGSLSPKKKKDSTKNESVKMENLSHFGKLNERKIELDHREKELNELESELHEQRKEIEVRIKKLEDVRSQIGKVLKERVEIDEEKVKKLVEVYSNMKPQNAAEIISSLNEDLAVEILGRMKKKNAAEILNLLKPEKAQVLTEKFAGYKRR